MSAISKNDFVAGVKKSGVIDKVKFNEWLQPVEGNSAQDIAAKLVRDQLLTKWQAKYLMSGRTRLDIGSYRLLERIQRDDLGDRFLALHTSLARKVDLLVLPSTFLEDETRCNEFMQKASLAATLDHPNLIHVFDIDREGGRLFLVTEHVEGTTLDKIGKSKLGEKEIAQFVSQMIAATRHAHENNVVHGCISQSDLVLTNDDEIKLQNLTVSPLRQLEAEADAAATFSDDYKAISEIGINLLNEIPEANRSAEFDTLAGVVGDVRASNPNSIDNVAQSLTNWLGTHHGPADEDAHSDSGLGGFDQPIATTKAPKKKKPIEQEPEQPLESKTKPGVVGRLWKENPVALIATAAVMAIMLVGVSAWGAISWLGDSGSAGLNNGSNQANELPGNLENRGAGKTNQDTRQIPDFGQEKPDFEDVEGMEKQIEKIAPADSDNPGLKSKENPPKTGVPKKNPPDTMAYKAPVTKAAVKLGPNKKHSVPANTPLKVFHQSSEGLVEVEVVVAGKTVNDWLSYDLIIDSAAANATNQPPSVPPKGPDNSKPAAGNPKGNAGVKPANPDPQNNKPTPEKQATPPAAQAPPAAPAPDSLMEIKGIGPATQKTLYELGITTFKQLASMTVEDLKKSLESAGSLRPGQQQHADWIRQAKLLSGAPPDSTDSDKATPTAAPKIIEPLAKFPRLTDLPPSSNTKEVKIADLVINNAYLLGAEIISPPGVSKTKMTFEIQRTTEDNQKWVVGVKRRANEKPTEVAYFRKSKDAFYFQWLPEAEKNKYANFLRNCYLKLNLPDDQSTLLTLRRPVKMRDLRLTENEMINAIEVEIPWLPDPENIVIEVLKPQIKGVDTQTANSGIEKNRPGKIWLKRSDKTGFLWLQVEAEFRAKLKLQSNLVLLANGQTKNIKSLKDLENLANFLKKNEAQAIAFNRQIQARTAAPGKKAELDAAKQRIQKEANEATAMRAKLSEYAETVPKLLNQPLSVRVYVKLGKLTTILAETDPTLFEKK